MCRLFGFRSVIQSQVHQSLVGAENAIAVQSAHHPHGWGVAYYLQDVPHVIKSADTALEDHIFQRVSGVVASETVLAHVRKATVGDIHILNAHPFQYGRWVFAHNGTVAGFAGVKEDLKEEILPRFRRYVLGDTDSEVLFYLFLTHLVQHADIERKGVEMEDLIAALRATIQVTLRCADARLEELGIEAEDPSKLTMMVTDGQTMAAVRHKVALHYSTYKNRCLDRDTCPYLAPECEAPTETGFVNHLIISSEPLQGDNIWIELEEDGYIGVDWRMKLHAGSLDLAPQEV